MTQSGHPYRSRGMPPRGSELPIACRLMTTRSVPHLFARRAAMITESMTTRLRNTVRRHRRNGLGHKASPGASIAYRTLNWKKQYRKVRPTILSPSLMASRFACDERSGLFLSTPIPAARALPFPSSAGRPLPCVRVRVQWEPRSLRAPRPARRPRAGSSARRIAR
jgi:hypothetical protein